MISIYYVVGLPDCIRRNLRMFPVGECDRLRAILHRSIYIYYTIKKALATSASF